MSPTDEALMGIAQQAAELADEVVMLKEVTLAASGVSEKTQRMNGATYALRRAASAVRAITMVAEKYPAGQKYDDPSGGGL